MIQAVTNAATEVVDGVAVHATDKAIVDNKSAVSQYYYDNNRNDTDVSLATITDDVATVTTATAALDAVIAAEEAAANAGETFTLTKSVDDEVVNGTALSDLFNATELGSLQDDDIVLDSSTTDNDILNANVNTAATATRIQNVETLNIDGAYVATGFNFTNVSNTQTANFNTDIAGGTATITGANSLNVATIKAGSNIATLDITSLASGTRDTVTVDAGSADLNLTGMAAGADSYNATVAADATVTLATLASANDAVTLNVAGDLTLDAGTGGADNAELDITINATTADSEITLSDATAINAEKIFITGTKDVTLVVNNGVAVAGNVATSVQAYDGTLITSTSTGTTTLEIETLANTDIANGNDFSRAQVDVIELSNDAAGTTPGITLNENTKLNLTSDLTAATVGLTVALDHGDENATAFTQGTLIVNVSEGQTNSIIADATVNTIIVEATPDEVTDLDQDENGFEETTMLVDDVTFDATTDVMVVQGSEDIEFTTITVATADQVIAATNMTGNLTIGAIVGAAVDDITIVGGKGNDSITTNAAQIYDVQSGEGNDYINIANAKAGTEVTAGTGNDTITSSANAATIDAGAGDDTVTAAGSDTITLGAGADNVKIGQDLNDAKDSVLVKDFVKGTDKITLTAIAAATAAIDLSDVTVASGVYEIIGNGDVTTDAAEWHFKLQNAGSNLTATDMRDSIALSGVTLFDGSVNILGDLSDTVTVAAGDEDVEITTGTGSDVVTIELSTGANDTTATIKDFTVGTDKIVLTGALDVGVSVNLKNVSDVSGLYTVGDATIGASFKVQNGGSNITTDNDLTGIVQLGSATDNFVAAGTGATVTVIGSDFDDYVELVGAASGETYVFSNNGGVDHLTITGNDALSLLNFNQLTGIDSSVTGGKSDFAVATDSKVGDAVNKGVYVFDGSANTNTDTEITTFQTHVANGYTQDVINAEVAAFIDGNLGTSDGENYVVIINDTTTATYDFAASVAGTAYDAYIYLVAADADGIDADDITLIGTVTDDNTAVTALDIA